QQEWVWSTKYPEQPEILSYLEHVADHLLLRRHSVVGLVNRAAAAGLLTRASDPADQRVVRVQLTKLGERRLQQLSALHLEELRRLAPSLRPVWQGLGAAG
ncbi:MAG: hypothetical protein JO050_08235, partial [Acidimicrobiia bacterium]|nr:hypothetical protein [Acidimicrobiia bacterium]